MVEKPISYYCPFKVKKGMLGAVFTFGNTVIPDYCAGTKKGQECHASLLSVGIGSTPSTSR
jgi:hypothetical protein